MVVENNKIKFVKGKNVDYIQFKILLKYNIKHLYTLRSENVDFSKYGEASKESYKLLCEELNLNPEDLRIPIQTHTSTIKCIDDTDLDLNNTDGLITNKKDKILITRNADCILFMLYDPKNNVIANVHSGWRGTFQKIVEKAVIKMKNMYNCNPEDIICCISPSIRKCHFEVAEDVKELCEGIFGFTNQTNKFIKKVENFKENTDKSSNENSKENADKNLFENSKENIDENLKENANINFKRNLNSNTEKYLIDTVEINKILLKELGLKEENIIDSNLCSVCNNDIVYSYRASDSKRNVALITLA
jgi:hypothetical protein